MKKIIYLLLVTLFLLLVTLFVFYLCNQEDEIIDTALKSKQEKVTVCHYDAYTDTWKPISIDVNALDAHLNHGDVMGDCLPQIGDFYQGGVVYYIFQPEDKGYVQGEVHGLIAATENQGRFQWGKICDSKELARNKDIGYGEQNTFEIVNTNCRPINSGDSYIAATICYDLTLNGYDDWFLPSFEELRNIYYQQDIIDAVSISHGGTPILELHSEFFWSSSNFDFGNWSAYRILMNTGNTWIAPKDWEAKVRAIRGF